MRNRILITAASAMLVIFATTQRARAADNYLLDPAHTSIVFAVSHTGMSFTYGFFREAAGGYILDKANPAANRFKVTIQTDSLDTNNAERDKHLRSEDFFNVEQFPTITFESTGCALGNAQDGDVVYQVTGNLTMHGVTKQITLPLRMLGEGQGPYGDRRTGFLTQLELKRSDYGMSNLLENGLVGDAVAVTISFEGTQQQPGAAGQRTRPQQ